MIMISQLSTMSMMIELAYQDMSLGHGTATLWKTGARYQLLTNWHVLAGKVPNSGQALDRTGAVPNRATLWWISAADNSQRVPGEILLRDSDGLPLWRVHPVLGKRIDLAAIDVEPPTGATPYCINELVSTSIRLMIGRDAFVVGYPYGRDQGTLPIWKRGSLATEPMLSVPGRPYQLIDTASRPGMSGSPLYLYERAGFDHDNGGYMMTSTPVQRFIGTYSGRLSSKNPLDLELGMYWPRAFSDQLLADGLQDPEF